MPEKTDPESELVCKAVCHFFKIMPIQLGDPTRPATAGTMWWISRVR